MSAKLRITGDTYMFTSDTSQKGHLHMYRRIIMFRGHILDGW